MRHLTAVLLTALLAIAPLPAQQGVRAAKREYGVSIARLQNLTAALDDYVTRGALVGGVLRVERHGQLVYQHAFGMRDREASDPLRPDAIFRIASQSKAVTSVAIMILADEKKLSIDDEVGRYLPSFATTTVAVKTDTGLALVEAEDKITIRHLLTHTAGISYGTDSIVAPLYAAQGLGPAAGFGWYTADREEPICETIEMLGRLPFVAQPGQAFVYGYNTDILGCIVEKVSGMSLDAFFRKRIINPLRMRDTYFFLPPEKTRRLATVYLSGEDGRARRAPDGAKGQGHYVTGPRRSFSGGAGLVSTARDYARFLQMLLNRGELEGARILSKKAVDEMTKNQVDELYNANGLGFGLGFEIVDREGAPGAFPEGTYGWGGAYGSRYTVVPADGMVIVLMFQLMPNGNDFRDVIPDLVYRALSTQGE